MTQRTEALRAVTARVLGGEVQNFSNPFAVLASPAWRGVEADIWKTDANGRAVIVKHYHPDTGFYVDPALAIEAAANAGALGVSPAVLGADASEGLVVFEALSDDWRCGGLQDAVVPDLRHATIAAKKRFQSGPGLSRNISVFEEIARFATLVAEGGITTHRHLPLFLDLMEKARARIAALGVDTRPCHRDGNTANLMIGPQGQVRLVDFDLAANCDPYEDMGCFLMEFFDGEQEARAGFEEWEGRFDEGLFQRAMVYGMADDLRWGLIGSILAERSPRQSLEFAKYASWRFMRLETMALSSHAADRLRHLN